MRNCFFSHRAALCRTTLLWPCAAYLLGLLTVCAASRAQTLEPAAAYAFDEGAGVSAADGSGHGNAATLFGGAAWTGGLAGSQAISLPGRPGSYAEISRPVVDTTRSFTAAAWVRLHSTRGTQTFLSLDGGLDSAGKALGSAFVLQLRGGVFGFNVPTRFSWAFPQSNLKPEVGVWHHVAGVYDAAAQSITLYVDGVFEDDLLITPTAPRATGATAIGRGEAGGRPSEFANADIDDVRFYPGALPAADVLKIARMGNPALPGAPAAQGPASLRIDAAHPGAHVNPLFYGLMIEEINHALDGGLYGELIQNRSFQDDPAVPVHWSPVPASGAGSLALDAQPVPGTALTASLRLTREAAAGERFGAANDGYWGIPAKPDTAYQASFYARCAAGFTGPLTADIESADGKVYASATMANVAPEWKRYRVTLKTGKIAPSKSNRFVISIDKPGTVWLADVSLFPPTYRNRPNGNRVDLMEKMAALHPAFLRLPGGNYLQGDTIATRYDWKSTLGPVAARPGHSGPWNYRSDDGLGLLEFLEWCEDLHMQPLLAVYDGLPLRGERVAVGPSLAPFVQDALDEIEYVTGDVHTRWGARRAADGHPAPFPLTYVEVGNEDFKDGSGSYDGRFAQFYDAIRARYPALQIIATTSVKSRMPDLLDEHFYKSPGKFERDARHYDTYSRQGPKIFVGEWAAAEFHFNPASPNGTATPDLDAALGDAAWLTGLERNADLVVLECYAPMLANVNPGAYQWPTNLIGFDALNSYGSPSYYVQTMFASNHGDVVLPATLTGEQLFASVTRNSRTGLIFLKMVNATGNAQLVNIQLDGVRSVDPMGTAVTLSGSRRTDTNSLANPVKIVPVTRAATGLAARFRYAFPPYSVTVLRIQTR